MKKNSKARWKRI